MEWTKQTYNSQYEKWVPWAEDLYLRWFTKDNKVSYSAKQQLDQTKVTGIGPVDTLQDGVNNLAAGQLGQGGLLQPVSDMGSKEGMNRVERQGKDDNGGYMPDAVSKGFSGAADGGKSVANKTGEGLGAVGGAVGGLLGGGGNKEEQKK